MKHLFTLILLLTFSQVYGQKVDTSEVYFELNIARVSTMASMSLDSLWFAKAISPGRKTLLYGYGDYLGTDQYNLALSEARAKNVKEYLVALGLDGNNIVACEGKGRIMRKPIPGQVGYYRDRKVLIITERPSKKAPKPMAAKTEPKAAPPPPTPKPKPAPKPKPTPPPPPPPKPVVAKVEPKPAPPPAPKPAPTPPPAPKPAPKPVSTIVEVKRKPEKDIATLDPSKLEVNDIIPLGTIFFAPGSNSMIRKSQPGLDQLFKFLNDNKNLSVEIQGHICCLDPVDGSDEPDGLGGTRSEGRAKNIYIFLVSRGIDRHRVKFVGLGNSKPAVSPERTESDRELNRRPTLRILSK